MRLLWQSFVDQAENAAYFKRLHVHLSGLAAPGTTVELKGMPGPKVGPEGRVIRPSDESTQD